MRDTNVEEVSAQNPALNAASSDQTARTFVATLSVHVDNQQLGSQQEEEVYISHKDGFATGCIIEVTPLQQNQEIEGSKAQISNFAGKRKNLPVEKNAEKCSCHVLPCICASKQSSRNSLVVWLGKNFYKPPKDPKKHFVSVQKAVADLHGFESNMQVQVRLVLKDELQLVDKLREFEIKRLAANEQNTAKVKKNNLNQLIVENALKNELQQIQQQMQAVNLFDYVAEKCEITFRDQYVSRRDMFQLIQMLNNKTVCKNNQMEFKDIRFRIRSLFTKKPEDQVQSDQVEGTKRAEQMSAIIKTNYTKFTFFSRSAYVYLLIEMSRETYEFDQDGFLYAEKFNFFVRNFLERCKSDGATHEIVFVLYGRLYYPNLKSREMLIQEAQKLCPDNDTNSFHSFGTFQHSNHTKTFQDVYQKAGVLSLDSSRPVWEQFLIQLKQQMNNFPSFVNWSINCPPNVRDMKVQNRKQPLLPKFMLPCELSTSEKSNLLESINVCMFNLINEEKDQNLKNTGIQLMILTAGQGTYRVNIDIISPTKSRAILSGLPIHILSFQRQPPYKTPLLVKCCNFESPFKQTDTNIITNTSKSAIQRDRTKPVKCAKTFTVPSWIEITYLHHIKLLETHFTGTAQIPVYYHLQKTSQIAPEFIKFQQTNMLRTVLKRDQKQERLFEPHPLFRKLERVAEIQKSPQMQAPEVEEAKTVRSTKKKFICIDPDDYTVIMPPVFKKQVDIQRQQAGKQELDQLMDIFDCEALLGNNLPKAKVEQIKAESSDHLSSSEERMRELNNPVLSQNQRKDQSALEYEPFVHNILDTQESVFETVSTLKQLQSSPESSLTKSAELKLATSQSETSKTSLQTMIMYIEQTPLSRTKPTSYTRMWAHSYLQQQFSFTKNYKETIDGFAFINCLSYDQIGQYKQQSKNEPLAGMRKQSILEQALTDNDNETLHRHMESFWRSLCDIKVFPLTTDYFPDLNNRLIHEKFLEEIHSLDMENADTIPENLSLRLSQNFQLVSPFGTCDFSLSQINNKKEYFKMSFRNRYAICQPMSKERCQILAYVKKKEVEKAVFAQFSYLLFNHNTQQFVRKEAKETRIMSRTQLSNIDLVQTDFKDAIQNCVRLPQTDCVIFCDPKALQRKLGHEKEIPKGISFKQVETLINKRTKEVEEFEMEQFIKIRELIYKMLTRNGLSKVNKANNLKSINEIKLKSRSELEQQISKVLQRKTTELKVQLDSYRIDLLQKANHISMPNDFMAEINRQLWPKNIQSSVLESSFHSNNKARSGGDSPTFGARSRIQSQDSEQNFGSFFSKNEVKNNFPKPQPFVDNSMTQCIVYLDNEDDSVQGHYMMTHDQTYLTSQCFHIKIHWLFAQGPMVNERVVKRLQRRVKEYSGDTFKCLPISDIIRNLELNPYIPTTVLREQKETMKTFRKLSEKAEKKESRVSDDVVSTYIEMVEIVEVDQQTKERGISEDLTQLAGRKMSDPSSTTTFAELENEIQHESMFNSFFKRILVYNCGFVLDCISVQTDCWNYIEAEHGLAYVRVWNNNRVTFNENDAVYRQLTQGFENPKLNDAREKVTAHILTLDILLDIVLAAMN